MPFTTPLYVGMQQKEDMLLQGRMWTAHDGWLKYPGIMESQNLHTIGINMYTVNGMGSFLDWGDPNMIQVNVHYGETNQVSTTSKSSRSSACSDDLGSEKKVQYQQFQWIIIILGIFQQPFWRYTK